MNNCKFVLKHILGKSRYKECISILPDIKPEDVALDVKLNKDIETTLSPIFNSYPSEILEDMRECIQNCINRNVELMSRTARPFSKFPYVLAALWYSPVYISVAVLLSDLIYEFYMGHNKKVNGTCYKDAYLMFNVNKIINRILERRGMF